MEKVFGTTWNLEVPWAVKEWWFTTRSEYRERHSRPAGWKKNSRFLRRFFSANMDHSHGSFPWLCVGLPASYCVSFCRR